MPSKNIRRVSGNLTIRISAKHFQRPKSDKQDERRIQFLAFRHLPLVSRVRLFLRSRLFRLLSPFVREELEIEDEPAIVKLGGQW